MSKKRDRARQPRAGEACIQARYDAAGTGKRMRGWVPPSSGPNRAITGLQNIRNRARDVSRNDWSGASGIQKWTTNLVGTGIVAALQERRLRRPRRRRSATCGTGG
jgi:capsid protein